MSTSNGVPADDDGLGLQVAVNSITLASFVSQLVILVTFIPDMKVFPTSLKVLSLVTIIFSMLSALVVFLSNNYACNPAVGVGCTLFMLGSLGKWCTYALRIYLLSYKRNMAVLVLMGVSMLATAGMFQWWCSELTGVRVLPRLCGPETNPARSFTDPLSSYMAAALNLLFIVLHVYYLWGYFREAAQSSAHFSGSKKSSTIAKPVSAQNGRLAATLTLFASSILVMISDMAQYILRRALSSNPFAFFLIVFGGQILTDVIYCSYMRKFANELLREEQFRSIPAAVYSPPSAQLREREEMGAVPGPDYVSIDGNRMNLQAPYPSNSRLSPVEMPAPFPTRVSGRYG
ncbi:hypothetical protein M427DRAFT_54685 [Gonapodya prolifera JEL478]|uniref:Uncharacterized protein n=1 Tax=Gonapodya prolifera (strain JEL478) TaxID=1344416 RepID=A0A139AKU5_GONPJ|nr:hypothetical protein M427DRAFT_54685 [Gonapodya prolifera JEL478]|eukprot:KXS17397.1 hypothetical protein M427DRAFT_54685 [Gonapodya prolifera JEL478]